MKLQTTKEIETNLQPVEENEFSIVANAKAFKILLDGLYTHKIRAVIRELWTNAYDSHIEAGIESMPFDCHLPNRFEPTFSVRDYGVSLSHEDVMHLYTRVFDSTKDQSDDFVGALGLGSKSPFAYTDSFIVVARLDGEKRTYIAAINETGTPTISLMSREPSEEAQGLEVSLAVNPSDFNEFAQEAKLLATGFNPVPEVDGIDIEPYEPVYVGDDGSFAIFNDERVYGSATLAVRQGCVIYPCDDWDITNPVRQIINSGHKLIINAPIGSVAMAANREALSLDEATKTYLKNAVKEVLAILQKEIEQRADACKNQLEAMHFWFGGGSGKQPFRVQPRFRGEILQPYIDIKGGGDWEIPYGKCGSEKQPRQMKQVSYQDIKTMKIVIMRDAPKVVRATMRYRELLKTYGRWDKTKVWLLRNPSHKQIERLYTLLGLRADQFVWVGDLPDPGPPIRAPKGANAPAKKTGTQGCYMIDSANYWHGGLEELPDSFYWYQIDSRPNRWSVYNEYNLLVRACSLGLERKPLIAMTPTAIKRLSPKASDEIKASDKLNTFIEANKHKAILSCEENYFFNTLNSVGLAEYVEYDKTLIANSDFNGILTWEQRDEAREKADKRLEPIRNRYPLLFESNRSDAIKWYVEQRDAELD